MHLISWILLVSQWDTFWNTILIVEIGSIFKALYYRHLFIICLFIAFDTSDYYLLKNVTPPMAETAWSFTLPLEMSYAAKRNVQNLLCDYVVTVAFLLMHKIWSSIKMCPNSFLLPQLLNILHWQVCFFPKSTSLYMCAWVRVWERKCKPHGRH